MSILLHMLRHLEHAGYKTIYFFESNFNCKFSTIVTYQIQKLPNPVSRIGLGAPWSPELLSVYCVCSACMWDVWPFRGQQRTSDLQDLRLQVIVNNLIWVLGTKFGSSERVASSLDYETIFLVP